jgi:hypothetical protein
MAAWVGCVCNLGRRLLVNFGVSVRGFISLFVNVGVSVRGFISLFVNVDVSVRGFISLFVNVGVTAPAGHALALCPDSRLPEPELRSIADRVIPRMDPCRPFTLSERSRRSTALGEGSNDVSGAALRCSSSCWQVAAGLRARAGRFQRTAA